MFTKEQLEGIIVSLANPEISIEKDDRQSIGYRIRLRVHFRALNNSFLTNLQLCLLDEKIETYYRSQEKTSRPYPVLRVAKVENLLKLFNLIPSELRYLDANNKFSTFYEVLTIISNKHHLTQKGFDKILKLKYNFTGSDKVWA